MSESTSTRQSKLQPFIEMNRYADRDSDIPSDEVYLPPRRTLNNHWRKFHAARDCGERSVRYCEQNSHKPVSDRYEYGLYCFSCGYAIPENEVLFIGGDWWNEYGWRTFGRPLDDLFIPAERVLELGPNPDEDELKHALNLGRIERECQSGMIGIRLPDNTFNDCQTCGQSTFITFDGDCRMCYNGELTDRMLDTLRAWGVQVREHNESYVHRLERYVDPCSIGGIAAHHQILWRRQSDGESPKLVEVYRRLEDKDNGSIEYILSDPTRSKTWRVTDDELREQYWSTELWADEHEPPVEDEEIRSVWENVEDT